MADPATITWRDAQKMPEDGRRYEAVQGELHVTAAPSARHQEISARLTAIVYRILVREEHGRLFHAPGVEFRATEEGVQPDVVFVSTERQAIIADDWIRGAPDLVVEILSPDTADRDRGMKLELYRRQGAPSTGSSTRGRTLWRSGSRPGRPAPPSRYRLTLTPLKVRPGRPCASRGRER